MVTAESMANSRNISSADLPNLSLLDDILVPPAAIIGIRSGEGTSIHERRAIGSARAASKAGIDALGISADVALWIVEKRSVPIVVANDLPVASIAYSRAILAYSLSRTKCSSTRRTRLDRHHLFVRQLQWERNFPRCMKLLASICVWESRWWLLQEQRMSFVRVPVQ